MPDKPTETAKPSKKPDLPWRKDVKWVAGILSVLCLLIALPLFTLADLTDKETSVNLSAHLFAALASPQGLDDETDITSLRTLLAQQKGAEIKPFPGVDIRVKEADIAGMKPREIRLFLFKQLGEPLWQSGEAGLNRAVEDQQMLAGLKAQGMGILPMMNRDNHDKFDGWARLLLFLGLTFLICAVSASRGFGYLVTPGLILVIAGMPGVLLMDKIEKVVEATAAKVVAPGGNPVEYLGYIATSALSGEMPDIGGPYDVMITLGLLCVLMAFLGNGLLFVFRTVRVGAAKLSQSRAKK